jgi:hypothetical protein
MKKRRVDSQNSFIKLVQENASRVFDCMVQFEEVWWDDSWGIFIISLVQTVRSTKKTNYTSLKDCFPESMGHHNHYSKFVKALSNTLACTTV